MDKNPQIEILIDSREQIPYLFSQRVRVAAATLAAGDYSLSGYETQIAVERKSLADFASTVILQRDRFKQELKKLQQYKAACIVVEAAASDILKRSYSNSNSSGASPEAVWGSAISIIVDYQIPIYFLENRAIACKFVEDYLVRYYKKVHTIIKAEREQRDRRKSIINTSGLLPGELRLPLVKTRIKTKN